MARRVFFSFHYDDIWRVNQVRNCWVVRGEKETAGFVDSAEFEKIERQGQSAIERWIDKQLEGTSATVVLIGYGTASRPYVQYEIRKSYDRGNALLGIYLDNIKDQEGRIHPLRGGNPFDSAYVGGTALGGRGAAVSSKVQIPLYDWVNDDGRINISTWIERAPKKGP